MLNSEPDHEAFARRAVANTEIDGNAGGREVLNFLVDEFGRGSNSQAVVQAIGAADAEHQITTAELTERVSLAVGLSELAVVEIADIDPRALSVPRARYIR